jgi:uncharacterized protein YidB (DUF937 family)
MSDLGRALIDSLDDDALEHLAERLGPRLADLVAARLGRSPNALHKLTAGREVPFAQDVAGGKCWFLRSELDAWRRGG